jgi:hypothetical protein
MRLDDRPRCYRPAPWHSQLLDANLENIAENYRIFVDMKGPMVDTYGATYFVGDRSWPLMGELAQAFFYPLLSPYWDTSSAPAMRSNYFLLAVTCVHEIAHALFDWRSMEENWIRADLGLSSVREPLDTLTDPLPELGWALEKWLYGGISEFNGDIFPVAALGLSWSPWNSDVDKELNIILGESYVQYRALSASSLAKLFDTTTWSGARSEPVNIGLTTMRAMMVNLEEESHVEPDYDRTFMARLEAIRMGVGREAARQMLKNRGKRTGLFHKPRRSGSSLARPSSRGSGGRTKSQSRRSP